MKRAATLALYDLSDDDRDRLIADADARNEAGIAGAGAEAWRSWYADDALIQTDQGVLTLEQLMGAFGAYDMTGVQDLVPTLKKLATGPDAPPQQVYFSGTVVYFLTEKASGNAVRLDEMFSAAGVLDAEGNFVCHYEALGLAFSPA